MSFKEATDTDPGDAAKYGAPDIKKIAQYLNGTADIATVVIDSSTTIQNGKLHVATITNTGVITLPTATTTLMGRDTTDTQTNKTLTSPIITTPTINGATIGDNTNIVLSTGIGTKIGTDVTQKLAFYNATPIVQPAANADTSGVILADLETEVNQIKQLLRDLGLMAP